MPFITNTVRYTAMSPAAITYRPVSMPAVPDYSGATW
jgi:hypothetical protein